MLGISEINLYTGKKKYAGLGVSDVRKLRRFKDENAKFNKKEADLCLDGLMLRDIIQKGGGWISKDDQLI
jgi:putative transposase